MRAHNSSKNGRQTRDAGRSRVGRGLRVKLAVENGHGPCALVAVVAQYIVVLRFLRKRRVWPRGRARRGGLIGYDWRSCWRQIVGADAVGAAAWISDIDARAVHGTHLTMCPPRLPGLLRMVLGKAALLRVGRLRNVPGAASLALSPGTLRRRTERRRARAQVWRLVRGRPAQDRNPVTQVWMLPDTT